VIALALAALALLAPLPARAAQVQVPRNDGWVTDGARLLSADEERALEARLESWKQATGHQIAVLTVPSLDGAALEDAVIAAARAWGIGTKERSDGALLFVARDDREMRIEVGSGLEGSLTDSVCGRILREVIAPRFRAGQFGAGVRAGVEGMIAVVDGGEQALPLARKPAHSPQGFGVSLFVLILILLVVVSIARRTRRAFGSPLGRRRGWGGPFGGFGGGFGGGTGGGFGGGGFSGGGFSGFGGGGFSGGGASGKW
jgi:uncharacterized protein